MPEDSQSALRIEREESGSRGRFALLDESGKRLGEMTFSRARDDLIIIDHTEVDESLRGQHGGQRLFEGMVAWARTSNTKVLSTCPFASAMFDRRPDTHDVLA